jgi:hypothetical protein
MPRKRNRHYLMGITDVEAMSVFFTVVDWSAAEQGEGSAPAIEWFSQAAHLASACFPQQ